MCIGFLQTIAIVFLCIIYTCKVEGRTQTIDLESNVCESRQSVTDQDVYNIIANPRTDLPSGRDHCNVFFTADPPIRKFYIYIKKIQIQDCGVSIKVYDGDPALKNHRWSISCKGPPAWKLLTWYGNIVIRLEKYSSSSSNNYNIDIVVTTDQGPIIDTGTSGSDMEGISTGAIIGIAVACGLAVIIIVGFILFCTCRMFKDKDDKHPPSTVFSTATSGEGAQVNGILKKGSLREKKSYDNPAYRRSMSDDLESGSNFSTVPGSERDRYDEVDEGTERRRGSQARDSYWDERRERINESMKRKEAGDGQGSMRQSRKDSLRKANRYRDRDKVDGRNPAYKSDRDRVLDKDRGHSNPAYDREDGERSSVKAIPLSSIGSLNNVRGKRNVRKGESESEASSATPSRATDDSRGSSSITDGQYSHKYRQRDDSMRRSRSRSSSRSSARGRRERTERSSHQQHLNHQPGQPRRHSHRSRRKKEKEPSPYLEIFKETKKKKPKS